MIKNMLPQDSRAVEIASAWALIFMSVCMLAGAVDIGPLQHAHDEIFWLIVLALIGLLQFWSLVIHPSAEVLRCVLAWVTGTFWVWLALADGPPTASDFATFTMGIGNLYAFVININLLRNDQHHSRR
jgi:hypothetical protein